MPNTIAHFAVAGVVTRQLLTDADRKWIFLACLVPDLPWILQRILVNSPLSINLYDLRAYAITQSSLLFSVVFGIGLACCFRDTRKLIGIFTLGCLIHLALDSLQIKWANGVQYYLPVDWSMTRLDLFWPESMQTWILTLLGLLYLLFNFKRATTPNPGEFEQGSKRRCLGLALLGIWLLAPLTLMDSAYKNDNHFIQTLSDQKQRIGKYVEFDRNVLIESENRLLLKTSFGESIPLNQHIGNTGDLVSIQAIFDHNGHLHVTDYHQHNAFRVIATKVGLLLVLLVWSIYFTRTYLQRKKATPALLGHRI